MMAAGTPYRRANAGVVFLAAALGGVLGALLTVFIVTHGMPGGAATVRPYKEVVTAGPSPAEGNAVVRAVQEVGPAVVNIGITAVGETSPLQQLFNPGAGPEIMRGKGSGFIINGQSGYIVTNNHVIEHARTIHVTLPDKRSFAGDHVRVLGRDPYGDIALLQVAPGGNLPEAKLGDSDRLLVGETAIAIGNPLIFDNTVTVGVISAKARELPAEQSGVRLENLLQTDAAINPGNSGGPLLNAQGLVVGMNTAIIPQAQGIGFSVAVNSIKRSISDILRYGEVRRPWIGVALIDLSTQNARELNLPKAEGALIMDVVPGGPSDRAGLRRYDLVTDAAGQAVKNTEDLRRIIRDKGVGSTIDLRGFRGPDLMTWKVQVGKMPPPDELQQGQ